MRRPHLASQQKRIPLGRLQKVYLMTTVARVVLADCEAALVELRADPQGLQWRVRWAAAVALLRAMLHVLKNIDSLGSPQMRAAIDIKWNELVNSTPSPAIFWSFIQRERNNLLKEYRTSAQQSVNIYLPGLELSVSLGGEPPAPVRPTQVARCEYSFRMGPGPYEGRDPRDIVAEAIAWLRTYLDEVDAIAARTAP